MFKHRSGKLDSARLEGYDFGGFRAGWLRAGNICQRSCQIRVQPVRDQPWVMGVTQMSVHRQIKLNQITRVHQEILRG
mgnify:CR=1 FL=1